MTRPGADLPDIQTRYHLLEKLGEGGTGAVYRAFDPADGREVALKVLHAPAGAQAALPQAEDEFRVLASLSHPQLAEVYDYGVTPLGIRYFTMELIRGVDLKTFVRRRLPREGERLERDGVFRDLLGQVLSALDFIHTRGVIHEDLKPSNILVQVGRPGGGHSRPRAKLIDFGLARSVETERLAISGTVEYMAPEKLRGGRGDARSDLYSLGVLLYELFTGEPPFHGLTPAEVSRSALERAPRGLDRLPPAFRDLTARLLAKSPADRPSTAREVLVGLLGEAALGENAGALLPAFGASFIGRERILARCADAFSRARSGRPAAVLLKGEAGIGKSRLLRELRLRFQLEGGRAAAAACREEGGRPGEALFRLARALAPEAGEAAAPARALLDLAQACGGAGEPPPLGDPVPLGHPVPLGDEAAKERLFHQAAELFLGLARQRPLVISVDDVQWADTLDMQFLLYFLRRLRDAESAGVALFLAARSEREEDRRAHAEIEEAGRSGAPIEPVDLDGLSEEEVRVYLGQALGAREAFPEELPRALCRDTGGNPFFIEELLKLIAERGGIERDGPRFRVLPGFSLETPGSVQEVIERRLARLGELPREILAWAAVLDEPFTAAELERYLKREAHEASAALAELSLAQVLTRDRRHYSLVHRRAGRVVYQSLPETDRRRRHGIAAERILAEADLEQDRRLERAAHHLFLSERPERAREYLVLAGERAQRSGALREAAQYLSRALEVTEGSAERFPLLLQREQVLGLLGDRPRQQEDLRELSRLAAALGDPRREAEALCREAVCLDAIGEKREALSRYDAAVALFGSVADRRGEARALSRRAMIQLMLGEMEPAGLALERAREIARGEGDRAQEAECRQMLGVGLYLRGRYDTALVEMTQALAIRRDLGEEHRVGALESNLGLIHFDRGDFEAAEERFKVSLKISRAIGFRRGEAMNLVNLGLTYSEMGRYERALDFIGEALRIRRELGDRWGEGTDLGNLGTVYVRLGRFERAVPLLEQALAIARQFGNRGSEGMNECKLGIVDLHRGDLDRAESRFRTGREIAAAHRLLSLELLASSQLARAALERRDPARALQALLEPLGRAVESGMTSWIIECQALRAASLLDLGRLEEALAASGEAVDALRKFRGWMERSHEVWFIRGRCLAAREARDGPPSEAGRAAGPGRGADSGGGAEEALALARSHLLEKADAIRDFDLRSGFLENLPLHRRIIEEHERRREALRLEASRRERSFYEISKSINSILELELLLERLLDLAVETTRAEKGMILLRDTAGRLRVKAARDMAQESIADAAEICQSVISDVSRRGEPILASDASVDERFRERKSIIDFRIRSLMCVPLLVRGRIIGAVYVDSRGETAFQQDDLLYLSSFAHLAAIAIDNARLLERLREENVYLRREVETRYRFQNLIGASAAMREVFDMMEKVARTPASVLVTGETGTGKELIARALHYHGPRKDRSFVAVDCGALPENLLESELFGHRRGAFSGALYDRVGLFEEAAGGTIFLDEITNTSPDLQAKLLRVLQESEIRRVGDNHYRKVDVRVIAATNLSMEKAVAEGRFREDLYYRLNVVPLRVPPLRERREDIPLLAAHFIERIAAKLGRRVEGFTEEAMTALVRAPWRGNVRELEHAIEKAVILSDRESLGLAAFSDLARSDLAPPGQGPSGQAPPDLPATGASQAGRGDHLPFDFAGLSLEDFDRRWLDTESAYLRYLVAQAEGNFSQAARLARVRNRNTLIARLRRHGIERP